MQGRTWSVAAVNSDNGPSDLQVSVVAEDATVLELHNIPFGGTPAATENNYTGRPGTAVPRLAQVFSVTQSNPGRIGIVAFKFELGV